jgi:hypothetical protein
MINKHVHKTVEKLALKENEAPLTYTSVVARCASKYVRAGKDVTPEGAASMQQVLVTCANAIVKMHRATVEYIERVRRLSGMVPSWVWVTEHSP